MLPLHGYGKSMSIPTTSNESFVLDRKVKKPLMEKYRRKRINDSLESLKDFVLLFEPQRHGVKRQLEKADILEKTVECLKKMGQLKGHAQDTQFAYEKRRKESFDEGFNAATRAVFEFFSVAMPPSTTNIAQQQFQLGLIAHMRMKMNQYSNLVPWVPASPKSETDSPSPARSDASPNPRKRPWQPWN